MKNAESGTQTWLENQATPIFLREFPAMFEYQRVSPLPSGKPTVCELETGDEWWLMIVNGIHPLVMSK